MAATSKAELLVISQREFAKLAELIEAVDAEVALQKDADDTSIKDVIAHRAHWIDLFLGWHADGLAGKAVHFPAEGYKWNDLKRYNADLRAKQSSLDWSDALDMLHDRFDALLSFIESRSDEQLYGGPMKGAKNNWTPGRWAEAAGPSHLRSAAKYVRTCLRDAK